MGQWNFWVSFGTAWLRPDERMIPPMVKSLHDIAFVTFSSPACSYLPETQVSSRPFDRAPNLLLSDTDTCARVYILQGHVNKLRPITAIAPRACMPTEIAIDLENGKR